MNAKDTIANYFRVFYTEEEFVNRTAAMLMPLGFNTDNSIASVCICRDEISQSILRHIYNQWGEAFSLASLGGMFIAGKMALKAAIHHAPETESRRRYVFYALPHIAIGSDCELGICSRPGIKESGACGALMHFHSELKGRHINLSFDEDDAEISILKRRILQALPYGDMPDLLSLTKTARSVIQADLERAISHVVDTSNSDYALFTGIQIHGHDQCNYISPDVSYAVIEDVRRDLNIC